MDIEYLLWLQGIRETAGPFVEGFMNLVSHLCDGTLVALIPCLIYWFFDKRAGLFVITNLAIGGNINQTIKDTACVYRPWIRDARVQPSPEALGHATGYSFPSGHTQSAGCAFGSLAWYYRKKRLLAVLLVVLTLLVGFSRNFLGVHTPQDVIVALIESAVAIWLSSILFDRFEKGSVKDTTILAVSLGIAVVLVLYTVCKPYPIDVIDGTVVYEPEAAIANAFNQIGVLVGVSTGWFLERRYVGFTTDCSRKQKVVRFVVCLLVVGLFFGASQLIKYALGRGILYGTTKGLFPAISGIFIGPAVSAPLERRFDPSGTTSPQESR